MLVEMMVVWKAVRMVASKVEWMVALLEMRMVVTMVALRVAKMVD